MSHFRRYGFAAGRFFNACNFWSNSTRELVDGLFGSFRLFRFGRFCSAVPLDVCFSSILSLYFRFLTTSHTTLRNAKCLLFAHLTLNAVSGSKRSFDRARSERFSTADGCFTFHQWRNLRQGRMPHIFHSKLSLLSSLSR